MGGTSELRNMRSLRFDAGAPSLDLVATVGRRASRPVERLAGTARLAEWFAGVGLPVAASAIDDTLLVRVRELRDASYVVLRSVLNGVHSEKVHGIDTVNAYAAGQVPVPQLVVGASALDVAWLPTGGLSAESALALLARDLIEHVGDAGWRQQLRTCSAEDCGMIYLDTSQGRRRRWCSMQACGNRAKAAKHRARVRS